MGCYFPTCNGAADGDFLVAMPDAESGPEPWKLP